LREELPEFDKIDLDIRKQLTRQETLVEQPIIQQAQKQMPDGIKLKAGAVKMLSYCASYGTITRTRLKTFAGLSANTFNSYLSILQSGQLIIVSGNEITITENGLGIVDAKPLPLTNQDVLSLWQHQFKKGIGEILAYICKNRSGVTIDNIRENMNLSENTLNSYLSILRSNDLIIELNGKFKPSDDMFPEG
jgi:predicted transcriptional regulator